MSHIQQGVDNGRVGASSAQMVHQDTQTIPCLRGPQLLKRAGKLYDIYEIPGRDFSAPNHHYPGYAFVQAARLGVSWWTYSESFLTTCRKLSSC